MGEFRVDNIKIKMKKINLLNTDGRKPFPINYGPTTKDKLLESATKICSEYMARDPAEVRFTMIALTSSE